MNKYKNLITVAQEPLSDNAYLDKCINEIYQFKLNKICSIKNTNSTYMMATTIFAKMLVGYDNPSRVIGRFGVGDDESGLPPKLETLSNTFFQQDRKVEQTRKIAHQINILDYYTGFTIVKCFKVPIINPATNNVLGTYAQNDDFIPDNSLSIILNMHGERFGKCASMDLGDNFSKQIYLTKLEHEVLFCICLGINEKKYIAQFLSFIHKQGVNVNTINDATRRLFRKFECKSSMQLIEYAVANSLHTQIPESFLTYGSFVLNI